MKIKFPVKGMDCASCAINVEKAVAKAQGVKTVSVNIGSEMLTAEIDPEVISENEVKKVVLDTGYEPMEMSEEEHRHHHREENVKKAGLRALASFFVSAPLVYLSIVGPIPFIPASAEIWVSLLLATIVIALSFNIWKSGFKGLLKLNPNMDSLIFLGTAVAYFYSLISTFSPQTGFPFYFESIGFILSFLALGKYLEALTKSRAGSAIEKLAGLQPRDALVLRNNKEILLPISQIEIGDIIVIKPGDKIPVDGKAIYGYSSVDEQMITGESIPNEKKIGDTVIGGTINQAGFLKIEATKIGRNTLLARIIKMVSDAVDSKPPIQALADKISFYFVPIVALIALVSLGLRLLFGEPFSTGLSGFIAVLVIACPCALGLATPVAVMVGAGLAAEKGILIKSGKAFQAAGKITAIVFDKTGTLTKGMPEVTDVIRINKNISESEILQIAASLEQKSEHPLAKAILSEAEKRNLEIYETENFASVPGKGVFGKISKDEIFVGSVNTAKAQIKNIREMEELGRALWQQGKSAMVVAKNNEAIGIIIVADELKPETQSVVTLLKKAGKNIYLLTGDNKETAKAIAEKAGINDFFAEVLPDKKAEVIKEMKTKGDFVAMVGDGINDAPAIAEADLGIAMGQGAEIAMESGDIVLVKNDLNRIPEAIKISRYTLRKIKQNLFWAFVYNAICIPIAAGAIYPFTGIQFNPEMAAAAMAFSSVSVILNSLLMKAKKI